MKSGWIAFLIAWSWTWLPWKAEYLPILEHAHVETSDRTDAALAWYDRGVIYLAPGKTIDLDELEWALLHETQHYLASKGRTYSDADWAKFARLAKQGLAKGDYTKAQRQELEDMLSYGAWEGHAQLPWITRGKIPQELQGFYPWFELTEEE